MALDREILGKLTAEGWLEKIAGWLGWFQIVPQNQKWVLCFAGGEISRVIFKGPNIIWPGERLLAIVKTDLFEVNPGPKEFDILRRQPLPGQEGERVLAEFDAVGLARIKNARWVVTNFMSCVDQETKVLDTARITQMIMEVVVSELKDFVLEYDYESLVEARQRRFDQDELKQRMNRAFAKYGIEFALFRISDPGATREFREALDDAASMRERAKAQIIDARADREAAAIRAEAATARARAMFDLIKEVASEEGVAPELRSLVLQMATILEMGSEDRGPNAPTPIIVSSMGGGDISTGLVLAELRRLSAAIEKREQRGDGRHERE